MRVEMGIDEMRSKIKANRLWNFVYPKAEKAIQETDFIYLSRANVKKDEKCVTTK